MKVNVDACLAPKKNGIQEAFDNAILTAVKGNFTSDAAIGSELAGEHFLAINDNQRAKQYFSRARKLYNEWGGMAKVARLDNMYGNCDEDNDDLASASSQQVQHLLY
jgi:phosphoribosyl-AMP cyclohydrolase